VAKGEPVIIRVSPECKTFEEAERYSYRLEMVDQTYTPTLRT